MADEIKGKILKYRKIVKEQKPTGPNPNFFVVTSEQDHVALELQRLKLRLSPKEAVILGLVLISAAKHTTEE